MSYHDKIQEVARLIELERRARYDAKRATVIQWSEVEMMYIQAILYKMLRVKLQTKDREKAKDDIIDAYNYCALLYEEVSK